MLVFCRCVLHSIPDPSPAEDLSRVSGESADLIRQLSVSHSGFCGGALQSDPGFYTWDFLQDQRYKRTDTRIQWRCKHPGFKLIYSPLFILSVLCVFVSVLHEVEEDTVEFSWKRNRLFNHTACLVLYQICMEVCGCLCVCVLCWAHHSVYIWIYVLARALLEC